MNKKCALCNIECKNCLFDRFCIVCTHDPKKLTGEPIGMYHCPECGEMVVAGCEHPVWSSVPKEQRCNY